MIITSKKLKSELSSIKWRKSMSMTGIMQKKLEDEAEQLRREIKRIDERNHRIKDVVLSMLFGLLICWMLHIAEFKGF